MTFYLDKAAEIGSFDVREGEGGKDTGERNYLTWDSASTADVRFVHSGASGMSRLQQAKTRVRCAAYKRLCVVQYIM